MASSSTDPTPPSYEDLAAIEDEFDQIETEILRKQYTLSKPTYAKRATAISRIADFWPLVFEQAPVDIDQFIQPRDSQILGESLLSFSITRPDLEESETGNPKNIHIRFEFGENAFFSDTVLEKSFWHRRAKDGWTGLVSEPTKVHWKGKKQDLSEGLTDAAVALFEARRKKAGSSTTTDDGKVWTSKDLPEYAALEKKLEHLNGASTSFFSWFGFVSSRRYVSAEESDAAMKDKKEKIASGEKADADGHEAEAEDEDDEDDQEVEVHEMGEQLALSLAEDLWPNAIKYFTDAMEQDPMSDADFEEDDEDGEGDEEDGEDEIVDIRSLVQEKTPKKGRANGGAEPPSKRQKN